VQIEVKFGKFEEIRVQFPARRDHQEEGCWHIKSIARYFKSEEMPLLALPLSGKKTPRKTAESLVAHERKG
jgi:hypothetical protein